MLRRPVHCMGGIRRIGRATGDRLDKAGATIGNRTACLEAGRREVDHFGDRGRGITGGGVSHWSE